MLVVKIYENRHVARSRAGDYAKLNNGVFRLVESVVDLKSHQVMFIGRDEIFERLAGRRFHAVDIETFVECTDLIWLKSNLNLYKDTE